MENRAVTYFREYLRIPSVHPDIDYSECVTFLKRFAKECGLSSTVLGKSSAKPVVILTWNGTDKNCGSILLNSHMDVVPVYKERWKYDPFEAVKDKEGNIYGRGAQDTKGIGIQYVEAIRRLIEEGFIPKRTVHVSYVPDEEIGGVEGMKAFVQTEDFKKLNVVFSLDEGAACPENKFIIFNDERCMMPIKIICNGTTGHGSLLHPNTAGEKLWKVLDDLMDFRESQVKEWSKFPNPLLHLAEVTTVNLTKLEGGIQNNVVPPEFSLTFDIRISVKTDHQQFQDWLQKVCTKAGEDVHYHILEDNPKAEETKVDQSNPFWMAFKGAMGQMNLEAVVIGSPGGTDARFLRRLGIPALGFSPMRNTPVLLHSDNEMVNEKVFLEGIDIYKNVIKALVNV